MLLLNLLETPSQKTGRATKNQMCSLYLNIKARNTLHFNNRGWKNYTCLHSLFKPDVPTCKKRKTGDIATEVLGGMGDCSGVRVFNFRLAGRLNVTIYHLITTTRVFDRFRQSMPYLSVVL